MIIRQKNNKNLLFIWSAGLLCCTFPAVGMIPFVIYRALKNEEENKYLLKFKNAVISSITSWQFLIGFICSFVIALYVASNINISRTASIVDAKTLSTFTTFLVKDVASTPFSAYPWTTRLYMYLWFVFLEFGLYFIVIYKAESHKPIYWLTLVVLLAAPLISIGGWLDFCMRGPIPAIFILYHMVLNSFEKYYEVNIGTSKEEITRQLPTSLTLIAEDDTRLSLTGTLHLFFENSKRHYLLIVPFEISIF